MAERLFKKDIQSLLRAIRTGGVDVVAGMLDAQPGLVGATASAPPKKDDGQSPLQVAFKCGNFAAASLLLDRGAGVNFHESSTVNAWTAPVLHDAIRAAAFSKDDGVAAKLLARLLDLGADPNCVDSYGNSALDRALLDARILTSSLPDYPCTIGCPEVRERLERIFGILIRAGADPNRSTRKDSARVRFAAEPALADLLNVTP